MITFTEFAKRKQLITDSDILQTLSNLESTLSKDNFITQAHQMYELVFNEPANENIFTGHKFFKTKVIKEPFSRIDLMEKGLHAFRMVLARHAEQIRHSGIEQFDTEGVIMYEDFLDYEHHLWVKAEIEKFPLIENIQPSNNVSNITSNSTPGLYGLIHNTDLINICIQAAHRKGSDQAAYDHFMKTTYVQRLVNQPGNGDIQKVCHSDVFYPCVKYWYFPDAVEEDQGPFLFAKNSVELTYERLDFHYRESVAVVNDTWDQRRNKGHGEGSFRAIDNDLHDMDLKLEPITCKPNTLVIANTSGFHCRGDAKQKHIRSALHGAIRVETPYDVE